MTSRAEAAARRKLIAARIAAEDDITAVCEQFGVCIVTVRNACHENNVPWPRRIRRHRPAGAFRILRQLMDGVPPKQIAGALGIHPDCVYRVARDARNEGWVLPKSEREVE